ncbi:MAG: hypothetical protein WCK34_07170 [Bacteroidota bacterium]
MVVNRPGFIVVVVIVFMAVMMLVIIIMGMVMVMFVIMDSEFVGVAASAGFAHVL